jgi:chemotaxis protein methyltransferase CheR
MIAAPELDEVERFRTALGRQLGLKFPDYQLPFLGDILRRRVERRGIGLGMYLEDLVDPAASEWEELADLATVGETYFFRNSGHFQVLIHDLAPLYHRTGRPLRILSAGCSTGEEPGTLAIILEDLRNASVIDDFQLTAIDLNPASLARARAGTYSSWALRETPANIQARWFKQSGRNFQLDPYILSRITYLQANLAAARPDPAWYAPSRYDVIFCRNCLMYLQPETISRAVARFATALEPNGHLFLGHAETLRGVSNAFQIRHTRESFYYQRGDGAATMAPPAHQAVAVAQHPAVSLIPPDANGESWVGVIRRASERVAALTGNDDASPASGSARFPAAPVSLASGPLPIGRNGFPPICAPVLDALRNERFVEALARFDALPDDVRRHPLAILLEAAVLVHGGESARALAACRAGLEHDHADARYHYLLALCLEQDGDIVNATHHYHAAAAHDPGFALPHLRLGLLARARHHHDEARKAFTRTLALIDHEDDVNITLFGGGFTRQAISRLCSGMTTGSQPW